jgi:predicted PurR-regulated permease PerM
MKTMMVRGSPILRYLLAAAAIVIVVFGLKYSSEVLAPIFFAATLAILFTPAFRMRSTQLKKTMTHLIPVVQR